MDINFLGTGAGIPSKERNVSALTLNLLQEINNIWLFDCGEATQHQILRTKIKPRKINKVFITHLHGDHIFGLPGFLSSRSFQGGLDNLTIYGPKGIKQFVETSLNISETHLAYKIHFVELIEGIIYEDEFFKVCCTPLDHNVKSYGFRIEEKDKTGKLNVQRLLEHGIPAGPLYQELKDNEKITMDDGKVLYRKDYIGEPKKGKVITIFGDTRYLPEQTGFIKGSDVLIHEATFDKEKADLAKNFFHSTTIQAAQLAKDANIGTLILTHISSRYQTEDEDRLLHEAQEIFPNTVLARDFFTYHI